MGRAARRPPTTCARRSRCSTRSATSATTSWPATTSIELCLELGRLDEAETLARQALAAVGGPRPDLQQAFTKELFGRVLLARSDPAAVGELRSALEWSRRLDGPRTGDIAGPAGVPGRRSAGRTGRVMPSPVGRTGQQTFGRPNGVTPFSERLARVQAQPDKVGSGGRNAHAIDAGVAPGERGASHPTDSGRHRGGGAGRKSRGGSRAVWEPTRPVRGGAWQDMRRQSRALGRPIDQSARSSPVA